MLLGTPTVITAGIVNEIAESAVLLAMFPSMGDCLFQTHTYKIGEISLNFH